MKWCVLILRFVNQKQGAVSADIDPVTVSLQKSLSKLLRNYRNAVSLEGRPWTPFAMNILVVHKAIKHAIEVAKSGHMS